MCELSTRRRRSPACRPRCTAGNAAHIASRCPAPPSAAAPPPKRANASSRLASNDSAEPRTREKILPAVAAADPRRSNRIFFMGLGGTMRRQRCHPRPPAVNGPAGGSTRKFSNAGRRRPHAPALPFARRVVEQRGGLPATIHLEPPSLDSLPRRARRRLCHHLHRVGLDLSRHPRGGGGHAAVCHGGHTLRAVNSRQVLEEFADV